MVYGYSRERNSLPNRINISTSTTFAGLNLPEFNGKALVNIHFRSRKHKHEAIYIFKSVSLDMRPISRDMSINHQALVKIVPVGRQFLLDRFALSPPQLREVCQSLYSGQLRGHLIQYLRGFSWGV